MLSKLREPVNALTHFFAAIASGAGLILLLAIGRGNMEHAVALSVYGLSLILLFAASAAYHSVRARPAAIATLRRLDHSAIFLLIAGTYTPFSAIMFDGFWKWGLLTIIWSLAAVGIFAKFFMMSSPRWLSAGIYLIMGWLCVAAIGEMLRVLPAGALILLLSGGLLYTMGAVVYITKRMNFWPGTFGFHELWHVFVMLGALAHFLAIAVYVAPVKPG